MKKKTPKKLALHRETVQRLEVTQLADVAGGNSGCCVPCESGTNCDISMCICD